MSYYSLISSMNKEIIPTYNTLIGGVSASITSASDLATVLGISSSIIEDFTIDGSNIKCNITSSYTIQASAFFNNTSITYYTDVANLVTDLGNFCFQNSTKIKVIDFKGIVTLTGNTLFASSSVEKVYLDNCTSVPNSAFASFTSNVDLYYLPRCATMGSTTGDNGVFTVTNFISSKIYVPVSLQTNNGGSPDGDIVYFLTKGATVRYVTNFTAPSAITNLSIGSQFNASLQCNFTAPSSTNTIDYYECYANGVFKNTIIGNGKYITNLLASTNYNITLIAVDIFFNKSSVSNNANASTNTTTQLNTTGLVSYYKLESNSNDSQGSNNGTDTSISYDLGKIFNGAFYNGTSSKTVIGNPANLQLSVLTISCWVKANMLVGSGDNGLIFKRYAYNLFFRVGKLSTYSYGSPVGYNDTNISVNNGQWRHLVITQDSGVTNGAKIYIDGALVLTTTVGISSQSDNLEFGAISGINFSKFQLDEVAIFNTIKTQIDVDDLYNFGNGVTL